jgi:hypothetical protein
MPIFAASIATAGKPLNQCSPSMYRGRGAGCSLRIACMIIGASGGSAPEWLPTSSAPLLSGMFSTPSASTRNQYR